MLVLSSLVLRIEHGLATTRQITPNVDTKDACFSKFSALHSINSRFSLFIETGEMLSLAVNWSINIKE